MFLTEKSVYVNMQEIDPKTSIGLFYIGFWESCSTYFAIYCNASLLLQYFLFFSRANSDVFSQQSFLKFQAFLSSELCFISNEEPPFQLTSDCSFAKLVNYVFLLYKWQQRFPQWTYLIFVSNLMCNHVHTINKICLHNNHYLGRNIIQTTH